LTRAPVVEICDFLISTIRLPSTTLGIGLWNSERKWVP